MNYNNIPEDIKKLARWVCWRFETKDGKITKIPVNPKTGGRAMSNNPSTWANYDQAIGAVNEKSWEGIGFMFGEGIVGVDLDDCIHNNAMSPIAKDIISTLDSYTEISQSGNGIHILCRGTLPEGERRRNGVEMYEKERFFIMTGDIIDDAHATIENRTKELEQIHYVYLKKPEKTQKNDEKTQKKHENQQKKYENFVFDHENLIKKASESKNGSLFSRLMSGDWQTDYNSQSEADIALCNILAFWTQKNDAMMDKIFRQSGLFRAKWDENRGAVGSYGEITIRKAIMDCVKTYDPMSTKTQSVPVKNTSKKVEIPFIEPNSDVKFFSADDIGNAKRLLNNYGKDIRYCCTFGKWLIWSGKHWEVDEKGKIYEYARDTAIKIMTEASYYKNENLTKVMKHAAASCNNNRLKAMVEQARSMPGIPITQSELDSNHWLVNCLSGTIDLKTGKLLPHNREDLITKIAPVEYDPKAKATLWEQFLMKIFDNNTDIISFIQRAVGYSLSGSVREQCIFIAYGSGANGKSTFINLIQKMMGDYSKNANMNSFLAKQNDSQTNDIARLVGSRFVPAMEADEGKKLSEALVKQLTGDDMISARFLHKEFFDFMPTFKIWMGTNHKPVIKGTDNAIWRRIMLIPFSVTIPPEERDKNLSKKLEREISGIFNWCIEGVLQWQQQGLNPPHDVQAATDSYRNEMDLIKAFLNDCCEYKQEGTLSSTIMYKAYQRWCDSNGENAVSQTKFSLKLKEKGMKAKKNCIIYWDQVVLSSYGNKIIMGVERESTLPSRESLKNTQMHWNDLT